MFLKHEATENIATPRGRDVSPSQGYPQQYVAVANSYTWAEKDNAE